MVLTSVAALYFGVPQGSVLGPPFLLFINDLKQNFARLATLLMTLIYCVLVTLSKSRTN